MSLNRLSSFRPKTVFMNSIADSPNALWVVFRDGYPLTDRNHQDAIVKLPTSSIRYLLGTEPIFGHSLAEGVVDKTRVRSLSASRIRGPVVVFLGWDESEAAITSGTYTKPKSASDLDGKFYLALSVDKIPRSQLSQIMEPSFQFCEARKAATMQNPFDMYILATARSMLDWNNRMKFCPSCGTASHSTWSGWRRCCSSLLPGVDNTGRESCPSETGLHNTEFPRTDAVVIVAIISTTGDKILLGLKGQNSYWSLVAGFMEPGETAAQAAIREVWEETGVRAQIASHVMSQAWPYPSNLMLGYRAIADASQVPRTDIDDELQDARWFTKKEIKAVLNHPTSINSYKRQTAIDIASQQGAATGPADPPFLLPWNTSIAGQLISAWAFESE